MPLYGSVGPPTGAPPKPGDPFQNFPNAGIYMSRNGDGSYVTQVVPDIEHPDNVQSFDSGAIGQPTAEQIWAFKLRVLANDIDLMSALIANMQASVPPNRNQWATGFQPLIQAIKDLSTASSAVCTEVGKS